MNLQKLWRAPAVPGATEEAGVPAGNLRTFRSQDRGAGEETGVPEGIVRSEAG